MKKQLPSILEDEEICNYLDKNEEILAYAVDKLPIQSFSKIVKNNQSKLLASNDLYKSYNNIKDFSKELTETYFKESIYVHSLLEEMKPYLDDVEYDLFEELAFDFLADMWDSIKDVFGSVYTSKTLSLSTAGTNLTNLVSGGAISSLLGVSMGAFTFATLPTLLLLFASMNLFKKSQIRTIKNFDLKLNELKNELSKEGIDINIDDKKLHKQFKSCSNNKCSKYKDQLDKVDTKDQKKQVLTQHALCAADCYMSILENDILFKYIDGYMKYLHKSGVDVKNIDSFYGMMNAPSPNKSIQKISRKITALMQRTLDNFYENDMKKQQKFINNLNKQVQTIATRIAKRG